MAKEIELKLETTEEGADALEASDRLPPRHETAELRATYFDTPEHDLRRNGLSLRVRRSGSRHVQTVKADGAPAIGVFDRGEWETPAKGGKPVNDGRTPVAELLDGRIESLVPVFAVPVRRKSWRMVESGAEIEIVLDRGEARAEGRSEAFCEVELELIRGSPAALFRLAREIDGVAPVRLGVLTKAERGFRLLGPVQHEAIAEDVFLNVGMTLPDAVAAIGQSCLRQYRLNEKALLGEYRAEAVHQARVALRRLRVGLMLFRDILGREEQRRFDEGLRELAGVLGNARDLDVLVGELPAGSTRDRLMEARPVARRALDDRIAEKQTRMLMLALAEWLLVGEWRDNPGADALRQQRLDEFAADALDRLLRKVRKHGRHLASLDPEHRHRLRKDAKKLRYAAEFFGSLFVTKTQRRRFRDFVRALKRLQNDLGALNDRAVAEARLTEAGLAQTADCTNYLSAWDEDALLKGAARHLDKLLERKPFWR